MPTILPISDLRNYGQVLDQVDTGHPVYLTRNGRGTYVISKIDDFDREATITELKALIAEAEEYSKDKPQTPIEAVAERFGVQL